MNQDSASAKPTNPDAVSVLQAAKTTQSDTASTPVTTPPTSDNAAATSDATPAESDTSKTDTKPTNPDAPTSDTKPTNPDASTAKPTNPDAPSVVKPATPDAVTPATSTASASTPDITASTDTSTSIYPQINEKLTPAQNILIALSASPSVDDLAAAIGLSLSLDRLGKRATAIYSGATPNALQFLEPEKTFESNTDALQDFVIALNKEKADHLRYKLDGNFVKIFITPYRTRISKEDLEFSYGDYNVDLIFALNVADGTDLDDALREHGRIMHDAVIVDVSTGEPGKLGEVEWNDTSASSLSEILAKYLYTISDNKLEKSEATAFLTGIIAATDRFSNSKTTPETLRLAAQLVTSGADPQLVSQNISPEVGSELNAALQGQKNIPKGEPTKEEPAKEGTTPTPKNVDKSTNTVSATIQNTSPEAISDSTATITSKFTPETTPEPAPETASEPTPEVTQESTPEPTPTNIPKPSTPVVPITMPKDMAESTPTPAPSSLPSVTATETKTDSPGSSLLNDLKAAEDTLSHSGSETIPDTSHRSVSLEEIRQAPEPPVSTPEQPSAPVNITSTPVSAGSTTPESPSSAPSIGSTNPAAASAPTVPDRPEINGVPEINYTPPADAEILPPPPAPPVELNSASASTPPDLNFIPTPVEETKTTASVAPTTAPAPEQGNTTSSPNPTNPAVTANSTTMEPVLPTVKSDSTGPTSTAPSTPDSAAPVATPISIPVSNPVTASTAPATPVASTSTPTAPIPTPAAPTASDPAAFQIPGM